MKIIGLCAPGQMCNVGVQMCNLLRAVGVTNERTVSQAHVLSVTHTQLTHNDGVHLLLAILMILMSQMESLMCRLRKFKANLWN